MKSRWVSVGALLCGWWVVAGAFGAHGLKDILDAYGLGIYETAVRYGLIHSLAVLVFGVAEGSQAANKQKAAFTKASAVPLLFLAGIFVFSGSLITLAFTGLRWLGAITPLGGVLMISGWARWAYETRSNK